MTADILLRNGRPNGGEAADILVRAGRIVQVGPGLDAPPGCPEVDAAGGIVLPGLVDAHTHLDKSIMGMGWRPNELGPTIADKIEGERRLRAEWGIDPRRQALRQIIRSVASGTTHILSFVDIDTDCGLSGLEGVTAARAETADLVDIQLVAFPQSGLLRRPGTLELMHEAMRRGAEWVGSIDPALSDRDPKGHLDAIFGLAERYGKPVDIHLHEPDAMGFLTLDLVFERIAALGMAAKVTISHAFCLAAPDRDMVRPVIEKLARHDVAIMTIGSPRLPVPPIKDLVAAGVRVSCGTDGVRDTWKPFGTTDMLRRTLAVAERCNFCRDEEIELALTHSTYGGAAVMGVADYGLAPGCIADFVVAPAEAVAELVVDCPPRKLVVKAGKVVARDGVADKTVP
jgi:cytosine deaminase